MLHSIITSTYFKELYVVPLKKCELLFVIPLKKCIFAPIISLKKCKKQITDNGQKTTKAYQMAIHSTLSVVLKTK